MTVYCTIKPNEVRRDGRVAIYVALYDATARRTSLKQTGKFVFPHDWDEQRREVLSRDSYAQQLNHHLGQVRQTLEGIILEIERQNRPLSFVIVWQQWLGEESGGTALTVYVPAKLAQIKMQVAPKTYQDYWGGFSRILQYQSNVRFEDITPDWLRQYEAVQRAKGRKVNGIFRDFSVLRKFFNLGRADGTIKNYPFGRDTAGRKKFVPRTETTYKEHLTPQQLQHLDEFFWEHGNSLPIGAQRTLGFYLFSCYTGLTHDDLLHRLEWRWEENHLVIRRKKTRSKGALTRIPLIPQAKRFLHHVKENQIKQKKARIREDLDRIQARTGLDKHLTYHTARHTFAINSLLRGVNIKVIQKILGHSSVKTTEVYLTILDEYTDQEMRKWNTND